LPRISTQTIWETVKSEYESAGWILEGDTFRAPTFVDKQQIREAVASHRLERAEKERQFVQRRAGALLKHFANGSEIDPTKFLPVLLPVDSDPLYADLFRLSTLFWSIPVSRGYGRRMRYILLDQQNDKLIGIMALGDPVFNLAARDEHIGWGVDERASRLYNVLDAYVLGAAPPYNALLCGKLVALSAITNEVRRDFKKKYRQNAPIIDGERKPASLTLVTTTSSLGRSSMYNRLRLPKEASRAYISVGYSGGWGHYHVSDATFLLMRQWLRQNSDPYADAHQYGDGPNWRMRTIRQAMNRLGVYGEPLKHGIQREVFVAPLAKNYQEYLRGDHRVPRYFDRPMSDVASYFTERWLLPRSQRISDWKLWTRQNTWTALSGRFANHITPLQLSLSLEPQS
jgi:hypothetical protein